jgi:sulfate adenylyltransferase subunit 1 (EFTu-like GTPase family)
VLSPGAEVVVLPNGRSTTIAAIDTFSGELDSAFPTMSVALRLADEIDISRGDMIVSPEDQPVASRELDAMLCWMSERQLSPRGKYTIKHTTRSARAIVEQIEYKVDINTLEHEPASQLDLNEIGRVQLRCSAPLMLDPYARNRSTGSFILIDESTNDTVAAGMVLNAR